MPTTHPPTVKDGCKWPDEVGILALEVYFPRYYVDQSELEKFDGVSEGKYTIGLGQKGMGFCSDVEDIHSLCLTVTQKLVQNTGIGYEDIGRLEVGTETIIDKSKSVKTVLMQLFEESGNSDVEGIDTTNACYGGTAALMNAVSWVESSAWDGRYALVVAGDIAIYATGNARPTGGCGAVAMLIGPNAPLVFDRGVRASYMTHVYDFYKPDLSSEYPTVDGKLSVSCYFRALDKCYEGYRRKAANVYGKEKITMEDFDAILFHTPYCKLVQKSLARLLLSDLLSDPHPNMEIKYKGLQNYRGVTLESTYYDRDLEKQLLMASNDIFLKKTKPSLSIATNVGNTYTASLYSCLASYLASEQREDLVGRRIGLFSYGSGSAATMFSITVNAQANSKFSLKNLQKSVSDLGARLESRKMVSPLTFTEMLKLREETHDLAPYKPQGKPNDLFPGTWYLTSIDEMHRRDYSKIPGLEMNGNGSSHNHSKKLNHHSTGITSTNGIKN